VPFFVCSLWRCWKASFLWLSILETCRKYHEINVNPFARLGSRLLDGREISQEFFSSGHKWYFYFFSGGYIDVAQWKEEKKTRLA
jgi:hypothetical protein